jgi:hypothetical protein
LRPIELNLDCMKFLIMKNRDKTLEIRVVHNVSSMLRSYLGRGNFEVTPLRLVRTMPNMI